LRRQLPGAAARDKAEFDQFTAERRRHPITNCIRQSPVAAPAADQQQNLA
jgi:hypothetical protein